MPAIKNNCLFEHSMSGRIESLFFFFLVKESQNYWLGWPTLKWLVLKFNKTLFNIFNGDIRDLNSLFCQLLNYNSYKNKIKKLLNCNNENQ